MNALESLLAIEKIKILKARYFRVVDTKDPVGFGNVFSPNGVLDLRLSNQPMNQATQSFDVEMPKDEIYKGREAIVELAQATMSNFISVHHGHTPEITIDNESEAHGIWAMEDHLWHPDGDQSMFMHGFGHYHERYTKINNDWFISYCQLTRIYILKNP